MNVSAKRILQAVLLEDWPLKFACVALAVLMWVYIDSELTDQTELPIAMRSSDLDLPAGWEIAPGQPLPKFMVKLRGPRHRLELLAPENIAFHKIAVPKPVPGRNALKVGPEDLEAKGVTVLSVTPRDEKGAAIELTRSAHPVPLAKPRRLVLPVRTMPLAGTAMSADPKDVAVEVLAEASDTDLQILLYVEWPADWDELPAASQVLGPQDAVVKAISPPGVQVRGVGGDAMPKVKVRGALAGELK